MDSAGLSSLRRLSETAGLSVSATSRVVHGDSLPAAETVTALSTALRVPESTIYKLTHGKDVHTRSWTPPTEIYRLSKRSQDAVTEMIRALASEQDQQRQTRSDDDSNDDEKVTPLPHRSREYQPPWKERDAAFEPGGREKGQEPGDL